MITIENNQLIISNFNCLRTRKWFLKFLLDTYSIVWLFSSLWPPSQPLHQQLPHLQGGSQVRHAKLGQCSRPHLGYLAGWAIETPRQYDPPCFAESKLESTSETTLAVVVLAAFNPPISMLPADMKARESNSWSFCIHWAKLLDDLQK